MEDVAIWVFVVEIGENQIADFSRNPFIFLNQV